MPPGRSPTGREGCDRMAARADQLAQPHPIALSARWVYRLQTHESASCSALDGRAVWSAEEREDFRHRAPGRDVSWTTEATCTHSRASAQTEPGLCTADGGRHDQGVSDLWHQTVAAGSCRIATVPGSHVRLGCANRLVAGTRTGAQRGADDVGARSGSPRRPHGSDEARERVCRTPSRENATSLVYLCMPMGRRWARLPALPIGVAVRAAAERRCPTGQGARPCASTPRLRHVGAARCSQT